MVAVDGDVDVDALSRAKPRDMLRHEITTREIYPPLTSLRTATLDSHNRNPSVDYLVNP